jgi:hypothetical protein
MHLKGSRDAAVLKEVVAALPLMAQHLGLDILTADLLPALLGIAHDRLASVDAAFVGASLPLLEALPHAHHEPLLSVLSKLAAGGGGPSGERCNAWRLRREVALLLGPLARTVPQASVTDVLWPAALTLCADPVAAVREAAGAQFGSLLAVVAPLVAGGQSDQEQSDSEEEDVPWQQQREQQHKHKVWQQQAPGAASNSTGDASDSGSSSSGGGSSSGDRGSGMNSSGGCSASSASSGNGSGGDDGRNAADAHGGAAESLQQPQGTTASASGALATLPQAPGSRGGPALQPGAGRRRSHSGRSGGSKDGAARPKPQAASRQWGGGHPALGRVIPDDGAPLPSALAASSPYSGYGDASAAGDDDDLPCALSAPPSASGPFASALADTAGAGAGSGSSSQSAAVDIPLPARSSRPRGSESFFSNNSGAGTDSGSSSDGDSSGASVSDSDGGSDSDGDDSRPIQRSTSGPVVGTPTSKLLHPALVPVGSWGSQQAAGTLLGGAAGSGSSSRRAGAAAKRRSRKAFPDCPRVLSARLGWARAAGSAPAAPRHRLGGESRAAPPPCLGRGDSAVSRGPAPPVGPQLDPLSVGPALYVDCLVQRFARAGSFQGRQLFVTIALGLLAHAAPLLPRRKLRMVTRALKALAADPVASVRVAVDCAAAALQTVAAERAPGDSGAWSGVEGAPCCGKGGGAAACATAQPAAVGGAPLQQPLLQAARALARSCGEGFDAASSALAPRARAASTPISACGPAP